jgi:hypothetical protein
MRRADRNQLSLRLDRPDDLACSGEINRIVEARVAERLQSDAFRWRLRLIMIESILLGALVAVAGAAVGQPGWIVLRAGLLIGGSCFATGVLLLGLSAAGARLLTRFRHWGAM